MTGRPESKLMKGQTLLLYSPHVPKCLSTKLHRVWSGPYYIVEIGPNHTFQLRHCVIHKPLKALMHANRLKNYDDAQDRNSAPVEDSQNDVNHDLFKLPTRSSCHK